MTTTIFGYDLLFPSKYGGARFNPIQDGLFWDCSRMDKICHTYPTAMNLGTVLPYLRKIQRLYKSSDSFLEFC